MKVPCDKQTDSLSVILKNYPLVFESDEDKPGIIPDDAKAKALLYLGTNLRASIKKINWKNKWRNWT